jgi:hypothetical protein
LSYPPPPQDPNDPNQPPPDASVPPVPPAPPAYGTPPPPPAYGTPPPAAPYGAPPAYGAPQYGAAPYGAPVSSTNQKGLWAMILGIVGLLCCGLAAIAALVLGIQAKNEIAASGGAQTNAGQAQAGYILGIIGCALWVVGIVVYAIAIAASS